MDATKTYNGWTNYETWNAKLWIDNDGSAEYWDERAEEHYRDASADATFSRIENATFTLLEEMKDSFEEGNPLTDAVGFYADIMSAALSEVNWHEIARHTLDDIDTDAIDAEDAEDESDDA